jgi:hypothetical protein
MWRTFENGGRLETYLIDGLRTLWKSFELQMLGEPEWQAIYSKRDELATLSISRICRLVSMRFYESHANGNRK